MKLTKTKILRAVATFMLAMLLPAAWRVTVIRVGFAPVFGALSFYVATPLALDSLAAALKKDALTAIWLAAFAAFLVFAAVQSFRLALTLDP